MIKKGEFLYRLVPSSDSLTERRERDQQQRER
jgi:hypothetical protein